MNKIRIFIGVLISSCLLAGSAESFALAGNGAARETMRATAVITEVIDATHVLIDRGSADGVMAADKTMQAFPVRSREGGSSASADYLIRLAKCRVVSLEKDSARLELRLLTEPVQPGDMVEYSLSVPAAYADDSLLYLTAEHVHLNKLGSEQPIVTLADLLEHPEAAFRDSVRRQMLEEIHENAELAKSVYAERIEGGRFHGKYLFDAFQKSTPEDIEAFLLFVREYPGKYIAHQWRLVEVYATWIINRTPTGEESHALKKMSPLIERADAAASRGEFEKAEVSYREALRVLPRDEALLSKLAKLETIRITRKTLSSDPDDSKARWALMDALYMFDAWKLADEQLDVLARIGYRAVDVERYRAYIKINRGQHRDAIAIFDRLLSNGLSDADKKSINKWRDYAASFLTLGKDPNSWRSHLTIAMIHENDKRYEKAVARYWDAMDAAKTMEEFEEASRGPRRITLLKAIDQQDTWIKNDIREHALQKAQERIKSVTALCRETGDRRCLLDRLDDWAETARMNYEDGLAIILLQTHIGIEPDSAESHRSLAYLLMLQGRISEAEAHTLAAIRLEPSNSYGHHLRAKWLLRTGDLRGARLEAEEAARDAGYIWPRQLLARIAAAEGRWDEAVEHANNALNLQPEEAGLQATMEAMVRGRDAVAAISAGVEVERNRLRLLRSFVQEEMPQQAASERAKLSGEMARLAAQAIADGSDFAFDLSQRLAEARLSGDASPVMKRKLEVLEAKAALAQQPGEPARLRLANALIATRGYNEALAVLGEAPNGSALADAVETARRGVEAEAEQRNGIELLQRLDSASAEERFRKLIAVHRDAGDSVGIAKAVWGLSGALGQLGRHDEAASQLDPFIRQLRADGFESLALELEHSQAAFRAEQGSLHAVREVLLRKREHCGLTDDAQCMSGVLHDLARLDIEEGHLGQGVELAMQSSLWAERSGNRLLQRNAIFMLAEAYRQSGDLAKTHELAGQLLVLAREARDAVNENLALMELGAVAVRRGDATAAREHFREVYEVGQRSGNTGMRAQARRWEGQAVLEAAHDAPAALPLLIKAAELYAGSGDLDGLQGTLLLQGRAEAQMGNVERARLTFSKASEIARKLQRDPAVAWVETEISLLESKAGRGAEAMKSARAAVAIADSLDLAETRWAAHHALGRALDAEKDTGAAVREYEIAIAILIDILNRSGSEDDRSGALGYGRVREVFSDAIDINLRSGNTVRAMELLDLSRDANLRNTFDPNRLNVRSASTQQALEQVKSTRQQARATGKALEDELSKPATARNAQRIEALSKVAAASDGELRQLLLRLKNDHRQLYGALAVEPTTLSKKRDQLPEGALVVEYFVASDAIYAFLLSRDQEKPRAIRIPVGADELERAVSDWRIAVGVQGKTRGAVRTVAGKSASASGDLAALSKKLYTWLLQPLEADMDAAKTVLVMPFGPLYYLPLHALQAPDGKYALEKYRIGYLSAKTISEMLGKQRLRDKPTLLAFANPDGTLPGARTEVERVRADSFPDARLFIEKDATQGRFFELAAKYRIVHFATHGILLRDATASYLKMADKPLTVNDIGGLEGLEGKTDLVVLSACETALELGQSQGDELISIASAFEMAGVPSLIASLWSVDDAATSELMVAFYAQLNSGKDVLDALREAQLHVMRFDKAGKRYNNPVYWAAFELIGDYR